MNRSLFLIAVIVGSFAASGFSQQHVFTNKQGVQIVAEIVSVNPDWKKMTIRKDGSQFEIAPNVLSLDDQQHIKNWLKERGITLPNQNHSSSSSGGAPTPAPGPAPSIDLDKISLDVKLNRKQVDSARGRYSDYMKLETRFYVFDIVVKSRSRETIPSPKVSYAVVWTERVSISGDNYESHSEENRAITGEKNFPQLTYNREETVTTERFEINEVVYDGNADYLEDDLIGVVAKVSLADGTVIGQFRTTGAENAGMTWEKASKLPGSGQRNRVMIDDDDSDDDPRTFFRMQKGQSEDGPIRLANRKIGITAKVTPDTNLGLLRDAGLVREEREGGFVYYHPARGRSGKFDDVWPVVREQLEDEPTTGPGVVSPFREDDVRLEAVRRQRRAQRETHGVGGRDQGRQIVPGRSWAAWSRALGLLMPARVVADLGCGDGHLTLEMAAWAREVIGVDRSSAVLGHARALARRRGVTNVRWKRGTLERVPLEDRTVDVVVLSQALHHACDPHRALGEAARVVAERGRVLVLDLEAHDQEWVRERLDDRWLGFERTELEEMMTDVGLRHVRVEIGLDEPPFRVVVAVGDGPRASRARRRG